jgi:hypothetical protein
MRNTTVELLAIAENHLRTVRVAIDELHRRGGNAELCAISIRMRELAIQAEPIERSA